VNKFYNKKDIPWVKLIWNAHYPNGEIPHAIKNKGSFWWRDVLVTLGFKIKTRCSLYVLSGSSYHTYGHNVNIENQCLYYINFITQNAIFTKRLGRLSC
jgi:hypothetical protein